MACAVLVWAALLGGCGGTSVPRVSELRASPLSKAAFLKRATALCERVREEALPRYAAYFKSHGLTMNRGDIASHAAEIFDALISVTYQEEVDGIRGLGAPKGEEGRVTAILNAIEAGIEAGKDGKALGFFYGTSPFRPAYVLAGPYGLGPCATG